MIKLEKKFSVVIKGGILNIKYVIMVLFIMRFLR